MGEGDPLAGVAGRYVAAEAILPGRDRADRRAPGSMSLEAGRLVGGPIGRGAGVRVVAGDATERPVAAGVALRLHQADRLVPDDHGVVGDDLPGGGPGTGGDGTRRRAASASRPSRRRARMASSAPSPRAVPPRRALRPARGTARTRHWAASWRRPGPTGCGPRPSWNGTRSSAGSPRRPSPAPADSHPDRARRPSARASGRAIGPGRNRSGDAPGRRGTRRPTRSA
jgi:hypothetical protein